jgi:hypothetical protein
MCAIGSDSGLNADRMKALGGRIQKHFEGKRVCRELANEKGWMATGFWRWW